MKAHNLFIIIILFSSIISCNKDIKISKEKDSKTELTEVKKPKIKHLEVDIEGMTCEIGCAKLIQSKIYKLEGISDSKVSFENKKGQFIFDSNKISIEEIIKNINGIAGGELYKVIETKLVDEFL